MPSPPISIEKKTKGGPMECEHFRFNEPLWPLKRVKNYGRKSGGRGTNNPFLQPTSKL